jgi:hypothetical protein
MFNDEVGPSIASGAFERTYGTLEQHHELEIQMIDDIHICCDMQHLPYFMLLVALSNPIWYLTYIWFKPVIVDNFCPRPMSNFKGYCP